MKPKKYWKRRIELREKQRKFYRACFYKSRYKLIYIRGGFKIIPIHERLSNEK